MYKREIWWSMSHTDGAICDHCNKKVNNHIEYDGDTMCYRCWMKSKYERF